jgi:hypothetical protein
MKSREGSCTTGKNAEEMKERQPSEDQRDEQDEM